METEEEENHVCHKYCLQHQIKLESKINIKLSPWKIMSGRDFSGEPGFQAPRKSLKLTGNPCWNSQFVHLK
jgi:hypothetical protein